MRGRGNHFHESIGAQRKEQRLRQLTSHWAIVEAIAARGQLG